MAGEDMGIRGYVESDEFKKRQEEKRAREAGDDKPAGGDDKPAGEEEEEEAGGDQGDQGAGDAAGQGDQGEGEGEGAGSDDQGEGEGDEAGQGDQGDDPDFDKKQEALIFQKTEGRYKTLDEVLEENNRLREQSAGPLKLTDEKLLEMDQKLREEKGYGLYDVIRNKTLDTSKMNPFERFYKAIELKYPDEPKSFYAQQQKKFEPITHMTPEQREEAFEKGDMDRSEFNDLVVEHDRILNGFEDSIQKYREKFSINDIFEIDNTPKADAVAEKFEPETLQKINTELSKELKSFKGVSQKASLANGLGEHDISIPIAEATKRDIMNVSPATLESYKREDGSYDLKSYVSDTAWRANQQDILGKMFQDVSSETIKRFLKNRDKVDQPNPGGDPKPAGELTSREKAANRIADAHTQPR